MSSTHITQADRATFAEYLQTGEEILWTGQPIPGKYAKLALGPGVLMLPFAVLFLVVFFFQMSSIAGPNARPEIALIPIGFVIIAVVISLFQLRRRAANTSYAATNRRLLVAHRGAFGKVRLKDYGRGTVEFLHVVEKRDGSGHIVFARGMEGNNNKNSGTLRGFLAVPEVRRVEGVIKAQEYAPRTTEIAPWYVRLLARF